MITSFTTKSGSVYWVAVALDGSTKVLRLKLGQKHHDRGPAQVAKRTNDTLGIGVWHQCESAVCAGPGDILRITFGPDDAIYTSQVLTVEFAE